MEGALIPLPLREGLKKNAARFHQSSGVEPKDLPAVLDHGGQPQASTSTKRLQLFRAFVMTTRIFVVVTGANTN